MAAVSLLEGAGLPILVALAIGLGLFVAVATVGTSAAGDAEVQSRRAAADTEVRPSGLAGRLDEWAQASQLGRDAEQVIGRKTGARI
jgi:O-antigen ligase